ncbi:MAG: Thiol-disulfide oxidoreductase ResA [Planctomycetota bacterium]
MPRIYIATICAGVRLSAGLLPSVAAIALLASAGAPTAEAAGPTVDYALGLRPSQKDVDYDLPEADAAKNASIKTEKVGGVSAFVVRGATGEILRVFADTNGDRVVDQWSYYKDGIEVFRDIDANFNTKTDHSRWLNSAGSRWGVDSNEDGTIDSWKAISAEEVCGQLVEAVKNRDTAAFQRLLPTKADLEATGFEGPRLAELAERVAAAPAEFAKMAAAQKQLGPGARWSTMMTPQPAGTMPAGSDGVGKDVVAYDNVMAIVEEGQKNGQLYVGSLLRCGDTWRPITAPQLSGDVGDSFGFFTPRPAAGGQADTGPQASERLKPLLGSLRELETKIAGAAGEARKKLVEEQAAVLGRVVEAAEPGERAFWVRQYAETMAAGVQEGSLAGGIASLERLATAVAADEPLSGFVMFRLAQARYAASMQQPGADVEKVQAAWLEELRDFVAKHPTSPDAAEAMLQMGIADEFAGKEREALERYAAIVKDFPESVAARKARGAARRLESVGKPLALSGVALDGKQVSLESLKGAPVLVHYWATWCEPCKVDMAQIRELAAKYGPKKFAVVGITVDSDKAQLEKFLKSKPLGWPQLHEAGGLDGRLAEELGILTLPTMILLDAEGKVVDRNVVITELEKKLDAMVEGK